MSPAQRRLAPLLCLVLFTACGGSTGAAPRANVGDAGRAGSGGSDGSADGSVGADGRSGSDGALGGDGGDGADAGTHAGDGGPSDGGRPVVDAGGPRDGGQGDDPFAGLSVEVGRTTWGSDFAVRPNVPSGGTLFSVWTRIPDPGSAYPWRRGNMDVYVLTGVNWHLRALVGNSGATSPNDATYNANSMLFADPAGTWIDDFSYYYVTGRPEAPVRDWVWAAWHVVVQGGNFTIRQYLKFGVDGQVTPAGESIISLAELRQKLVQRGWSQADANAWSPGEATSFQVGSDHAFLYHARMAAQAGEPSLAELDAIARRASADPDAWADYPFSWRDGRPELRDVSGHGRDLSVGRNGALHEGLAPPALSP